jgi:small-conductance mechanosensitive channel
MKFAVLFVIGVVVAAAVGTGAVYIMQPTAQKEDYRARVEANETAIAGLRSAVEKSNNDTVAAIGSLNESMLLLSGRIKELRKKLDELAEAPAGRAAPGQKAAGGEAAPSEIEDLVEKVVKEREEVQQKERQEQMSERMEGMQKMAQDMMNARLNDFAKKKNWNIAKQEAVNQIIEDSMKKVGELFRGFRADGPPSQETMEQMRQVMEETEAKLKEVMTEEEWKEFQETMPGPGMFGPGRMPPGGPGQNPPEGR